MGIVHDHRCHRAINSAIVPLSGKGGVIDVTHVRENNELKLRNSGSRNATVAGPRRELDTS